MKTERTSPTPLQAKSAGAISPAQPQGGNALAVKALQQRCTELSDSIRFTEKELERWRKENGGFTSMSRLAAGAKQVTANVQAGKLSFWEGAGQKVSDPET